MLLVLSVAIVSAGPETELNRGSVPPRAGRPARWHPTRAAGRRGPTLPVPTASVRRGRGRGGGSRDKRPSMSPRGRLPSWGGGESRESSAGGLLTPCLSPLLPSSPPCELGPPGGPLWPSGSSSNRPSTSGPRSYCSLRQDRPSRRPLPSPAPRSLCPQELSPETPAEANLPPEHLRLYLPLYCLSRHRGVSCTPLVSFRSPREVPRPGNRAWHTPDAQETPAKLPGKSHTLER